MDDVLSHKLLAAVEIELICEPGDSELAAYLCLIQSKTGQDPWTQHVSLSSTHSGVCCTSLLIKFGRFRRFERVFYLISWVLWLQGVSRALFTGVSWRLLVACFYEHRTEVLLLILVRRLALHDELGSHIIEVFVVAFWAPIDPGVWSKHRRRHTRLLRTAELGLDHHEVLVPCRSEVLAWIVAAIDFGYHDSLS